MASDPSTAPGDSEAAPLVIGGKSFRRGESGIVDIPVAHRITHEPVSLRVQIWRGRRPGPRLFLSAGLHGDEINGVEIVRRVLRSPRLRRLRGDLVAAAVVNVPAFQTRSRYMPDRRDLNRLFPGSPRGSMGARLAHVFLEEVVARSDLGIDFHTGAICRPNLPQIRICPKDPEALRLARSFGAPVVMVSGVREGSLRAAALDRQLPILVFEGGEAVRLDATSIRFGVRGVFSVMRAARMLPLTKAAKSAASSSARPRTVIAHSSYWERAPRGGIFTPLVPLGKAVQAGDPLGFIADPLGAAETEVACSRDGIVIGRTNYALADEGDGIFHIAVIDDPAAAADHIQQHGADLDDPIDHPVSDDPFLG